MSTIRIYSRFLGLLIALFGWSFAHAAEGPSQPPSYRIDVWGEDQGLPQSSIISLAETQDGYLWLGTLTGLVRFDGVRFTVFDEGNTPGLNSSRIVHLYEDRAGNLWIGTETAGVVVALAGQGKVQGIDLGRGYREGRLIAACEDPSGAVWLYTASGEVCRYLNGRGDVWNLDDALALGGEIGRTRSSPRQAHRGMVWDGDGKIWVGMSHGLLAIDAGQVVVERELPVVNDQPARNLEGLLAAKSGGFWRLADGRVQRWRDGNMERDFGLYPWDTRVSALCEDVEGNLVVGTLGSGVFWFNAEGRSSHLSTRHGLSHNYVLSLHVDRQGSLWVGTDGGGLNRVKQQRFSTVPDTRDWVVQSVCEDGQGGVWIGSNRGGGIGSNSGGIAHWRDGAQDRYSTTLPVWSVFRDQQGRVWAGTGGAGLFQFQNGRFERLSGQPEAPQIHAIHQDPQGTMWFGTAQGLLSWRDGQWRVYTTADGLPANIVRAIAHDRDGDIWIGTMGGGLCRLRDGAFEVFRKSEDGLPSENISSLYVDSDGVLWIGTFGSGLARFEKGAWTRYTTRQGLANNNLAYLVEDEAGYLWIGSTSGLMRVPKSSLNDVAARRASAVPCRIYTKADGLPSREITQGSQPGAARGSDGRIWFPTINGLAVVNTRELKPSSFVPPVVIEAVFVDGEMRSNDGMRAAPLESFRLTPRNERIEIHFTALNLAAPDRTRFRYQLEGHEAAWTEAGETRVARFTGLSPGEYRFRVIASNEDGIWNESGAVMGFIIEPPFWRTWWFIAAMTILLLAGVAAIVYVASTQRLQRQLEGMRQKEALERERARIARDLHDQLGANLTQVSLLGEMVESDKDQPEEVEAHAQQISRTARDTTRALDEIVWAANPSNDTLEGLVNYVCKYAQEYLAVAGLRYRLEIPAELPDLIIPPEVRHNVFLAAKEAITNIVRHSRATSAWLRLHLHPGRFTLEIADDGKGFENFDAAAAASRNGLKNMKRRMDDVGGKFEIAANPEGGAIIRLSAPAQRN